MQIGITWVTGIPVAVLFTCRIAWGRQKIPTVVSTIKQSTFFEIIPDICTYICEVRGPVPSGGGMFGSLSLRACCAAFAFYADVTAH